MSADPETVIRGLWFAWLASWLVAAFWRDRAIKRPSLTREIVYRLLVIVGWVLLFGLGSTGRPAGALLWRPSREVGWVLLGVTAVGLAFTWWARLHLGRLWSSSVTRKADHHIVDTGPYGIVRHPIYTGLLLAVFATALLPTTVATVLGAASFVLGFYVKARTEEAFLREQLGEEGYRSYATRVPMLIPFLRA